MSPTTNTNRRTFLRQLGLGSLSAGLLTGFQHCKGDMDNVKPFNPYTFRTNPKDPLILKVNTQAGELIEYYGARNTDGIPKSIDVVSYRTDAKKEEATYCYFDSQSNLSKVIAEDGSQFLFKWTATNKAVLTFVSGDKAHQLSTEIDFAKPSGASGRVAVIPASAETSVQARDGQRVRFSEPRQPEPEPGGLAMARMAAQSVMVDVKKCGFPADADVWVYMYKYDKLNQLVKVGQYQTYRVTKGMYDCMLIPDEAAAKLEVNPQKMCKWAIDQGVCKAGASAVSAGLCLGLTAVAAGYSGGAAARVALAACNKWVSRALNQVVTYGCKQVIDDVAATQKAYEYCDAQFENVDYRLWTGNLLFIARAFGVGAKPIDSKGVEIDGKSPYPKLNIDLGGSPTVNSLVLQPAKPLVRQSYVAQAILDCLPSGTRVTMSIVGTDGYQDSVTSTVSSLLSDGTYVAKLMVPGAKLVGINDTVTLVADVANGKQLRQTASLVFV